MPLSDDQALARATAVYAEYLAMVDTILGEGGRDPERIRQVASGQAADDFIRDTQDFIDHAAHTTGRTSFDSVRLQSNSAESVIFYACEDVTKIDVTDGLGKSFVQPDRKPFTSFVIEVSGGPPQMVTDRTPWTGGGVC